MAIPTRAGILAPVYLHILDSQVELRDARDLWGLTTSRAEEAIRNAWGDDKIKTAIIGPAGEHLVRFAGIQVTSQRSAARCGLGAVMGSKNLKAIAARGHGKVPLADPGRFRELARDFRRRLRENPIYPAVHGHGTPGIVSLMNALGRFPTKNFQMGARGPRLCAPYGLLQLPGRLRQTVPPCRRPLRRHGTA
jgi:aldehyde:ferredoxin oxidoreductase